MRTANGSPLAKPSRTDPQHAVWEREMRRLGVSTRLFAVILAAVVARILISGLTVTSGIVAAVTALLTLASLLLTRYGRRHEPSSRRSTSTKRQKLNG
jgi:hypothetical protein